MGVQVGGGNTENAPRNFPQMTTAITQSIPLLVLFTKLKRQLLLLVVGGLKLGCWHAAEWTLSLSLSLCLLVTGMLDVLGRRVWLRIQDQVGQSNYVSF